VRAHVLDAVASLAEHEQRGTRVVRQLVGVGEVVARDVGREAGDDARLEGDAEPALERIAVGLLGRAGAQREQGQGPGPSEPACTAC
jgi:hypothetical protein